MNKIYLLLLFFFPFVLFAQNKSANDTLLISAQKLGTDIKTMSVSFGKKNPENISWRVNTNDSMQFALPTYNDSLWDLYNNNILYNDSIKQQVANKVSWFRGKIYVDSSASNMSSAFVFNGSGAAQIYWDGELISEISNIGKSSDHQYVDLLAYPIFVSLGDSGLHVLAVRYENKDDSDGWGIELSSVKKSYNVYKELKNTLIISSVVLIGLGALFLSLFIIHMLFFLFYSKGVWNFYFALFNFGIALAMLCMYYSIVSDKKFIDGYTIASILSISLIASCFALGAFTSALFGRNKTFLYVILILSIIASVTTLIDIYTSSSFSGYIVLLLSILSITYTIIQIILAIYRKEPGAGILGIGVLYFLSVLIILFVIASVSTLFRINNFIGLLLISAFLSFIISISAFLAWRFSHISKSLNRQLITVETLSIEKQQILESQNEELEMKVNERTQELQIEKQKSDDLLLNILPQEVANELKTKGESKAQQYDEVSVLFTDFVNFTQTSEYLGVDELLKELNINFTAFDRIMEKHGMEKIKTIGDAYLAVSGLPLANPRHAQNAVNAALEIIEFVQKRKNEVPYGLDIRIGINSGSLIAGIIGVKKFAYDIWGDTVNIAARMEQSSEPGKINISENTFELIKNEFDCEYRGKIKAKGKGEMNMYFAENIKRI